MTKQPTEKKTLVDQFKEIMNEKDWDTTPITINGQFVKFLDSDVDNMWLGFCAAHGILDRALDREKDVIKNIR